MVIKLQIAKVCRYHLTCLIFSNSIFQTRLRVINKFIEVWLFHIPPSFNSSHNKYFTFTFLYITDVINYFTGHWNSVKCIPDAVYVFLKYVSHTSWFWNAKVGMHGIRRYEIITRNNEEKKAKKTRCKNTRCKN